MDYTHGEFKEITAHEDGNRVRLSVQIGSRGPGQSALRHGVSDR
jgi:hypothetical protein